MCPVNPVNDASWHHDFIKKNEKMYLKFATPLFELDSTQHFRFLKVY